MNMNEQVMWYWGEASQDEKNLHDRFADYCEDGSFFDDMLFRPGSSTYELVKCKSKLADSDEWIDDEPPMPDEIKYFMPTFFRTVISDNEEYSGCYRHKEQKIEISSEYAKDDKVLLHEMIHLFEEVINEQPLYFHDTLYWALYTSLREKIVGLDEAIAQHAHLLNEWSIQKEGGNHDILFLLKSFDLDIRMGYPLGTVFGYGRIDDFKSLKYNQD